jgi:TonB family protein
MYAVPVMLLSAACLTGPEQPFETPPLLAEWGADYSFKDGAHELDRGAGWLRIGRLYLDFRLTFDFKVPANDSNAGVMIRSWPSRPGVTPIGYRFRFPNHSLVDPATLFVGQRETVSLVEKGVIKLRAPGEWQSAEIHAEGRRVRILLNGALLGAFEVETFGGHVLFDSRKGRVQLNSVRIAAIEQVFVMPENTMRYSELQKAGGVPPKLVREIRPNYTPEGIANRRQGVVHLDVVVMPDGSVGGVRVTKPADEGFNFAAIAAIRQWEFTPGRLNGTPVPVVVEVEMTFSLGG